MHLVYIHTGLHICYHSIRAHNLLKTLLNRRSSPLFFFYKFFFFNGCQKSPYHHSHQHPKFHPILSKWRIANTLHGLSCSNPPSSIPSRKPYQSPSQTTTFCSFFLNSYRGRKCQSDFRI